MSNRVVAFVLVAFIGGTARAEAQFFMAPQAVPGEDFNVELALMFWRPAPELRIQTGALGVSGDDQVDFVQEFGLENRRFREFRGVLKPGRKHKLRVSYLPVGYEQEATMQRTITFGARTFDVNVPATADITWDLWRFGYEWDFVSGERALLGVIGELKYNKVSAAIESAVGSELAEATAPVPALGVIARAYIHRNVSITAEFTGFKMPRRISRWIGDDDVEATFRDFDLYATASISRHFGVQAGYRSLTADYLVEEDRGDLKLKGTYFGAMVRF